MPNRSVRVAIAGINYAPEPTGIAPYTSRLASGLVSRGHDVGVFTGVPHYPQWKRGNRSRFRSVEHIDGVRVRRFNHTVPRGVSWPARLLMELTFGSQVVTSGWRRPDVLVCVSPPLTATALIVARARLIPRRRRPAIGIIVHDLYGRGVKEMNRLSSGLTRLLTRFESATLRAADGVAVIHRGFAEDLIDQGVSAGRIREIRNWSHVDKASAEAGTEFRSRHGWGPDEIVVLHAGNIGYKQGLENLVAAARIADERALPLRFVLMGDGNQRSALQASAVDVPTLEFVPPVAREDFSAALGAADVLIVNERPGVAHMAVPSKLTSYFRAGKPIIAATDAGGFTATELAAAGAGICVAADRPELLVDEVIRVAGDAELSARLGSAGKRYCDRLLSEDSALDEYDRMIRELAEIRSRGRILSSSEL